MMIGPIRQAPGLEPGADGFSLEKKLSVTYNARP
jgi:hypothetical protein